jgi:hypothetical protein
MSGQALNWFVEKLQAVNWSAVFAHDWAQAAYQ